MIEANIYKALGDPTRLEMVKRLASGDDYTIGELSTNLGITRQGARKQLQVLVSANLIRLTPQGRETRVDLELTTLTTAKQFIAAIEQQWDQRLAALKRFAEEE
ncbi:helix-turn-helix domain-containing protein [Thalassotalea sp. 1_MG-2023]|uniref:ArsR/SmtB family transcription factor n=1 Tax=Thalassotalea sp. 1_MG-2023 TaxID=3062680 RepID=UPI0026E36BBA|nr:helix-turn-helix domain-containing protein [Thalassotalea sp. 1_MG-2023]MDO6428714.1 helix-turn-helix domain-containing protein [Thalassotalea sp. 1_MG-2023]